jgi:hypothetical protein
MRPYGWRLKTRSSIGTPLTCGTPSLWPRGIRGRLRVLRCVRDRQAEGQPSCLRHLLASEIAFFCLSGSAEEMLCCCKDMWLLGQFEPISSESGGHSYSIRPPVVTIIVGLEAQRVQLSRAEAPSACSHGGLGTLRRPSDACATGGGRVGSPRQSRM